MGDIANDHVWTFNVHYVDYVSQNYRISLLRAIVSIMFSTIIQSCVINFKLHHQFLIISNVRTLRETAVVHEFVITIGIALPKHEWVVQGVISDWVVQGVISDWVVQGVISDWARSHK